MRFRTLTLPSLNNRSNESFQEERGNPSIISRAKSCWISSLEDRVSSMVLTMAASWTSTLRSSKSICRFDMAVCNCFT